MATKRQQYNTITLVEVMNTKRQGYFTITLEEGEM